MTGAVAGANRPTELDLALPPVRKAAALGESGYGRAALDAYFTEPWCVGALLDRLALPARVHEPACGDGAIVKVLEAHGHDAVASDIHDYGCGYAVRDFFSLGRDDPTGPFKAIVTNPPYDGGERFIAQALNLTEPCRGRVAMILRQEWDCAASRRYLFKNHPAFALKLTLTRRPKWRVHGQPAVTDQAAPRFQFAWYVWDWTHHGKPVLEYGP